MAHKANRDPLKKPLDNYAIVNRFTAGRLYDDIKTWFIGPRSGRHQRCAGAQAAGPIRIVAAENMYGDIASQIGGDLVAVSSILNNPNQDPASFHDQPVGCNRSGRSEYRYRQWRRLRPLDGGTAGCTAGAGGGLLLR